MKPNGKFDYKEKVKNDWIYLHRSTSGNNRSVFGVYDIGSSLSQAIMRTN